jgi:hypothetical protein
MTLLAILFAFFLLTGVTTEKDEATLFLELVECKTPDRAYIDPDIHDCGTGESATDCAEPKYFSICLPAIDAKSIPRCLTLPLNADAKPDGSCGKYYGFSVTRLYFR